MLDVFGKHKNTVNLNLSPQMLLFCFIKIYKNAQA